MRTCKYCGAEIPDDARFCGICGRVPDASIDAQATERYSSPDQSAQRSNIPSNAPYPAKGSSRRPYQYVPLPQEPGLQPQPDWPVAEPPGAYYQQENARPASWQQGSPQPQPPLVLRSPGSYPQGASPARLPNAPSYPAQPPPIPGNGGAIPGLRAKAPRRPLRRRKGCMIGCLSVLILLVVFSTLVIVTAQKVLAFGSAISTQSSLSSQTNYMNTSDRVNILIMGYGGAGHDGAYLTDSLVVMSLIPSSHHTTLLSVPRDLWVQYPNSQNSTKINAIYTIASNGSANSVAGGDAIAKEVSQITGLNIQYWIIVNFTGFRNFIDAIGGVNVNVPDAFTANYPKNDDPSINASWITVHFSKGMQLMNGATAIVYARARYVLDNNAEGTDFARSRRQQLIMQSALSKLKDWHTWPSLYSALDALKGTLFSNLSLADLASFALKMDLTNAHRLGFTNSNVLVDANNGQSILLPRNNDWQLLKDYVNQGLFN